jgi:hypothetical protein
MARRKTRTLEVRSEPSVLGLRLPKRDSLASNLGPGFLAPLLQAHPPVAC